MSNHTSIDDLVEKHKKEAQSESITISKEGEPIQVKVEQKVEPKIDNAESEPQIEDKEVEKYLNVERNDIKLDPALKKAGLQVIESSSLDPRHNVKLPITDDNIIEGLHKPVNSSWRWLAEIAVLLLRRAHISLKKIHGHIVRVIKK